MIPELPTRPIGITHRSRKRERLKEGSLEMTGPNETTLETRTARRSCLVNGCPCQDARIVSPRRAAFNATIARANGETADRAIAPEDGWRIPAA